MSSGTAEQLVLIFDSSCLQCSRVAQLVRDGARNPVDVVSIRDPRGRELLDSVYPSGWDFRPYLVRLTNEQTRAFHGPRLAWELLRLLGLIGSLRVWSALRNGPVQPLPPTPANSGRRRFLAQAGLLLAALAVGMRFTTRQVEAGCLTCCNDSTWVWVRRLCELVRFKHLQHIRRLQPVRQLLR